MLLAQLGLWLGICAVAAGWMGSSRAGGGLEEADQLMERGEFAAALETLLPFAFHGIADAQYKVGVIYDYAQQAGGRGVAENPFEAVKWYRKAAEQGHARAQRNLGACYDAGRGVIADPVEAARWYRAAALQGDAFAEYSLGLMYYEGRGVEKRLDRAYAWLARGLHHGLLPVQRDRATEILKGIEADMTPDELTRARQMANAPPGSRLAP